MDLVFDRVNKRYEHREALSDLSFEIHSGEMAFLTGHSGAGKSTLLRLLLLLDRASSGEVSVGGRPLSKVKESRIAKYRQDFGVVFQDHKLLADRSVYHNVALPLEIAGFTKRDIDRRVRAALDKVGLLDRARAAPDALSGGEQQRTALARAVIASPKILLADEPTGNLDYENGKIVADYLFELHSENNATLVLVTHDLELANRCERKIKISDGEIFTQ